MGKQLFGTDGIRGTAGEPPLDAATVYAFGLALGSDLAARHAAPQVLLGADTRESGGWIAETVAGGLAARGVTARWAGVVTTPGVAWLTRSGPFAAGVMISASHNQYRDNGIKVFGHSGYKIPDAEEHEVEEEIFRLLDAGVEPARAALEPDPGLDRQYLDFLLSTIGVRLEGKRVVLDCGNGAAWEIGPRVFRELGAEVTAIGAAPDGRNINLDCGALHVEGLQKAVTASGADFGAAFDGDADRAIFVGSDGSVVNGDAVLLIAARALRAQGRLRGDMVIATVMSNLGLEVALRGEGIRLVRTAVGDKYVLEEMLRLDASLGGEQSGHVIFRDCATTGDGVLTALRLAEIAVRAGCALEDLAADLEIYPQKLVNVRVRERKPLAGLPSVASEIRRCEESFGEAGRVLVRFSGTEPLARVMVEGPDLRLVDEFSARIADAIRREMGA